MSFIQPFQLIVRATVRCDVLHGVMQGRYESAPTPPLATEGRTAILRRRFQVDWITALRRAAVLPPAPVGRLQSAAVIGENGSHHSQGLQGLHGQLGSCLQMVASMIQVRFVRVTEPRHFWRRCC